MEKYSRPTAFLSALFLVIFTCLALTLTHPANAVDWTANDDASLRAAISGANNGDTINFTADITLASSLPVINKEITIHGNNHVVDGISTHRIFSVETVGQVVIENLEVKNGLAGGTDGGVNPAGGGGGGGLGAGGGLFVNNGADVTISNVTFTNNTAQGGDGGDGNIVAADGDGGAGGDGPSGGGGAGGTGGVALVGNPGDDGGFGGGGGGGEGDGGGQGGNGGTGGFGAGGGGGGYGSGAAGSGGNGGFGGGAGGGNVLGQTGGGGGGAGLGGAVFVRTGGTLTVLDGGLPRDTVTAGTGGANGGSAGTLTAGDALYVMTGTTGTFQVTNTNTKEVSGEIAGGGGIAKTGSGTLVLSALNVYTGGTTIDGGTLRLENNLALGTGDLTVLGSTLDLDNGINLVNPIDLRHDLTISQNDAGGSANIISIIGETGGSFGLVKTGVGTIALFGINTYTGATTVSDGTLQVGSATALPSGTNLQIDSGGTLDLNNFNASVGTFNGAGTLSLGSANITTNAGVNALFSGDINGTGGFVKQGTGTLTLSGINTYSGGTTVSAGTLQGNTNSLQGDIANNASVVFDQGTVGTYAGVMSGTGSLTKQGTGTLTLSGTNTYLGGTSINGGTLSVGADINLGNTAGGLTFDNGTLQTTSGFTTNRGVTLNAGGGTVDTNGNNNTLSGVISGTGSLTKQGAGTLTLSNTNTYTGGTTINGGTLGIGVTGATGTGTITVLGSTIAYENGVTEANLIDLQANATLNVATGSAEQSGQITETGGSFGIEKTGTGTLTLSGTNTYSGGTSINGGTLSVGADNNLGDASGNLIFNGGTLQTTADINSDRSVTLNAAGGTLDTSGNDLSLSGIISGTGGLTKQGTGTLSLSGANRYTGGTTVSGGTLQGNTTSLQGDIANNASVVFDQGTVGTYAGVMSGTGSLTKQGTGTLTLSGTNTYLGGTSINGGTLSVGADINLGNTAGGLTFDNGTLQTTSGFTTNRGVTLNAGGGTVDTNGNNNTLSGVISGTGSLTKQGAGTLTLSNTNTYTGGTTINGGTLGIGVTGATGTGTITVLGSTIAYENGVTEANLIDLQANATLNVATGSAEQSGQITETGGSFGIEKTGTGTLTLSGTNTYSGGTSINGGTLSVGADNNLGDASGNLIFNGGTLQTTADINSDRSVTLNAAGGTLDTSGNDLSLSGIISGTGGLTKQGTGTLSLSGANTYTGGTTVSGGTLQGDTTSLQGDITNNAAVTFDQGTDGTYGSVMSGTGTLGKQGSALLTITGNNTFTGATTINAGTLMVNGAIAGPVIVNTGGTLGGTGTVGPVTNSGRIEPGNSIGTLTVAGNYTHNVGATYEVELDAAGNSDLIDVTGAATINGGIVDAQAAPGPYAPNSIYTILQAAGGVTGTFDTLTCNLVFLDPSLVYNPNNVLLILTRNTMNYANVAITFNQVAVGTALDKLAPSAAGDMLTALNNINGLTASQARFAYDQMGGASHSAYTATSFNMADQHRQTVARHMEAFRTGLLIDVPRPPVVGWDLWTSGLGVAGHSDGDDVASRYDYNIYGFLVGMDRRFSDHFLAGICGGYARADVDLDILADSGHIESYLACLYTSYVKGPWYLDTLFSYADNRYHTLRGITFGNISRIATGDYDGYEYLGYLEGGYTLESGNARIQPMLSLQASHLSRDSFMETGADDLNLVAADESFTSIQGSLGMRLFKDYKTEGGAILRPEARARWTHELSGDDHLLNARFAGSTATPFLVKGDRPDRHGVVLGLGLTARVRKDLTFRMDYDASISGNLVIHAATALLVFSW